MAVVSNNSFKRYLIHRSLSLTLKIRTRVHVNFMVCPVIDTAKKNFIKVFTCREKNLYVRYFRSIFVLLKISDETIWYWSCEECPEV